MKLTVLYTTCTMNRVNCVASWAHQVFSVASVFVTYSQGKITAHFISRGIWLQHLVSVGLQLLISGMLHFSTGQLIALTGNSISCTWYNETVYIHKEVITKHGHIECLLQIQSTGGKKIKWFNKSNSNLHKPLKPDINTHTPLFLSFSTAAANVFH